MPKTIHLSNNTSFEGILIIDRSWGSDNGRWRAFWAHLDNDGVIKSQVPMEGLVTSNPYRTRALAAIRAKKLYPNEKVYRVTRLGKLGKPIV